MRVKAILVLSAGVAIFLGSCRSARPLQDKCGPDTVSIVIHAPDENNVHVLPEKAVVCNKKQDIVWASVSGELTSIKFKGNDLDDPTNPPPPDPDCLTTGRKNKCELKKDKLKVGRFAYSVQGEAENGEKFDLDPEVIIIP